MPPARAVVFDFNGTLCVAVLGTLTPARLAQADEVVPALDVELLRRLL